MELPDFNLYSIDELDELANAARDAFRNRQTITLAESRIDAILVEVKTAQGRADGDAWVQPLGAHGAYPMGAEVAHEGKKWRSILTANVWPPGISGWDEIVEPGQIADWRQPTGSHDVYNVGDRVRYEGKVWTSTIAANVWAPGVYGWQVDA
ncbi:hypothetical protein SEA_BAILEYBLU_19 [Arthrobacter phage BaileyBlu]|uniref:Chitin-binding type-3 domain-containing protein n=1 Tax=Arthrobacter phage BaileyBlu TaxID=2910754 RepID=A0AA49BPS0_9CAUD|nr:minor tail protein [Arthrobacter phage BaileyBlu]UJQ87157.1 hypothetical protein SEA_BAILEYBLU_19 [Arthrobacter phage BaileyBlu]